MANFKRGKCRRHSYPQRGSEAAIRARLGLKPVRVDRSTLEWPSREYRMVYPSWYNPMSRNPAHWDIQYHTRPHRSRTRRLEKAILRGADPDNIAWPVPGKPTIYYW